MQYVDAFFHELLVVSVESVGFFKDPVELFDLLDAGFSGDDGPDGVLDGGLLVL